jgi:AraC-like DNA-binding protein
MGSNLLKHVPGFERLYEGGHRETILFPNLNASLPVFIYSVGFKEENQPSYDLNGLHRGRADQAVIQYTLSGRGRLRYQDSEMYVEPGQAMLLYFPHDHRYWIEEGERWEFFYVTLGGREAARGMRDVVDRLGPVTALDDNSPALMRTADVCATALENKIDSPYRASELAYSVIMELLNEGVMRGSRRKALSPKAPSFVGDVEEFCRLNYSRPIGVEDMARVAKLSRFHFTRLFERARGIPPGRYLARLRLEEAMRLVTAGDTTVKDVAQRCGFGDANYFCKVFRKSFGVSPGSFRAGRA